MLRCWRYKQVTLKNNADQYCQGLLTITFSQPTNDITSSAVRTTPSCTHPEVSLRAVHGVGVLGEVASDGCQAGLQVIDIVSGDVSAIYDPPHLVQLVLHGLKLLVEGARGSAHLDVAALLGQAVCLTCEGTTRRVLGGRNRV
jgi:hypothetical protein